jgi:hypothetical protein
VEGKHQLHTHDSIVDLGHAFAAFTAPNATRLKELSHLKDMELWWVLGMHV